MKYHKTMSIDVALIISRSPIGSFMLNRDVRHKDLRADLKRMKKEGMTHIPNADCPNPNPDGTCPGHEE